MPFTPEQNRQLDDIETAFKADCEKKTQQELQTLVENFHKMTVFQSDMLRKIVIVKDILKRKFGV